MIADKPKFDTSSENIMWAIEVLSEIEAPTKTETNPMDMSQQEIDLTLVALTRGMQMFDAILAIIENVQADSRTELLRKLINERTQWTCELIVALNPTVN